MPISSFISSSYEFISLPKILILPSSIFKIFKMDFTNVVFPAPFSPIRPTIIPSGISILIPPKVKPPSYFFTKFSILIALLIFITLH